MAIPISPAAVDGMMSADIGAYSSRRPLFTTIRWGAILAGVMVGMSVQLALSVLGLASGVAETGPQGSVRPLLWAAFNMLVAALVAGYIAARMCGLKRRADGVLHGAVSWAVTTILFAVVAGSGGIGVMSSVLNSLAQAQQGETSSAPAAVDNGGAPAMDPESFNRFQQALRMGDRETAVVQLMRATNMDRARAEGIVDQALSMGANDESALQAPSSARAASAIRPATAAWVVFAAVAMGLGCGMAGGAWGAAGARRTPWLGRSGPAEARTA